MTPLAIGLVGFGKIARDEHLPAIQATPGTRLHAIATPEGAEATVPVYASLGAMLAAEPALDAVALCQPPAARFAAAREALAAGKHVFLEKPPGATLAEVAALEELAERAGVTLFAGWHSRWSQSARSFGEMCRSRRLDRVEIRWEEDVRRWHPGQNWIQEPGGFGVFDPGINALSILTEMLADPIRVVSAQLEIPENWRTPIAAKLVMESTEGTSIHASFDWRKTGEQVWQIEAVAGEEQLLFDQATTGPGAGDTPLGEEYRAMYQYFERLVRAGRSEVDPGPLRLVADACLCARTATVARFDTGTF